MRTIVGLGAGLVVVGLVSASLAAGCGNGDDDDTTTDGGSTTDGGTTPKDSGTVGSDGGGSGTGDSGGGGTTTAGSLLFAAGGTDNNSVPTGYQIVGIFVTGSTSGTGGGGACGAVVGNCQYCGGNLDAGTVKVDLTQLSAGTLTVDDGTTAIASLSYDTTEQVYQSDSEQTGQSTAVWGAGDNLNVSAPGAAFPAFTGSIKAPQPFTGVTPAFADETPLTVATSGLTVSWTPAGDSSQVKLLLGVEADLNSTSVSCTVADSAGQIVVPASLLAQLASSGDSSGVVGLTRTLAATATATGGDTVALTAQALQYSGEFNFSQ